MRGMWLFCLCVFLLAQPEEVLVIDDFESEGGWQPHAPEGSTLRVIRDPLNAKVGQASLGMEAEFTAPCGEDKCYAIISREAPDLSDYAYLRIWMRTGSPTEAYFGIALQTSDGKYYLHPVPLDKTGWNLITVAFSQFTSEEDPHGSPAPDDIEYISLVLGSKTPIKVRVNVDELLALADSNRNNIPDTDEGQVIDAARNSEEFADDYFESGDYGRAEKYYQEALSLYQRIGNQKKAQEMDLKARESRAWFDYNEAENLYVQKEYLRAMESYEKARREFVKLGNSDMADTIEDRLTELSKITGEPVPPLPEKPDSSDIPQPRDRGGGGLLFVFIVVALVGIGVYMWKFRGAPQPEKAEEEPVSPLTSSEAKAEEIRKLKAKFVYGEINRQEYEKRLRELEDRA